MSKHDDLVTKLKEIFQIDKPELDFGVYRILNARVAEINDYLENRLQAKVQESLRVAGAVNTEHLKKELSEVEKSAQALGMNPNDVPKVQELRKKLSESGSGSAEHENAVFSHLLTFFSRYYDSGDFISQRRYKGDTYAIPYAGEEVVLHWANKDQYYTKSGENFSNYGFKLDDGRSVRFRLVAADTAKDNRKDNDKERRFVLLESQTRFLTDENGDEVEETLLPVTEENGELVIRFEYKAMPKGSKQDALVLEAVQKILADEIVKARWLDLTRREPTEKNPQRTLLEKCLSSYTSKNSADYFIHKDLGGFLRRELDFYIKNEVMQLDDVQAAETFADIEKNLRLIQTLRAIALDLIAFLAQLEDFQKKLWLKKKFVVATHYCLTLDRVPESLYAAIANNPLQWQQWRDLGVLESKRDLVHQAEVGTVDFLREQPFLMVDTALFGADFKAALLAQLDDLDESLDGLLIHGDNFQGLSLLQERYREQVKCVYIDPPYNTGGDGFIYKDGYKSSTWITSLFDRISIGKQLNTSDGIIFSSIDDKEVSNLDWILSSIYGFDPDVYPLIWHLPRGINAGHIAKAHEYILPYFLNRAETKKFNKPAAISQTSIERCNKQIDKRHPESEITFPAGIEFEGKDAVFENEISGSELVRIISRKMIFESGKLKNEVTLSAGWTVRNMILNWLDGKPVFDSKGQPIKRFFFKENGKLYYEKDVNTYSAKSVITGLADTQDATNELLNLFKDGSFVYPKPSAILKYLFELSTSQVDIILDYFAGSGTTAHAVINLNREDASTNSAQAGKRKYILVEQGDYFDTVLKPRIQKVVYSADWKDGKATAPETGISHAFKILKLESYEDTLNNLQLGRSQAQQTTLDSLSEQAREDYLLNYLLNIESRGSLLSVAHFNKPFDCKLKITTDSAGAYSEQTVDLVETFNYLIGLRVTHLDMQLNQGLVTVTGFLPTGEKTLILWRDVEQVNYEKLNRLCEKLAINPADSEFDVVYINGDHNIPAVFTSLENEGGITKTLKIRQIEAEFLSRMFE